MVLDEIVTAKKRELALAKEKTSLSELGALIAQRRVPLDFVTALKSDGVSIIAEVKKASPSKGVLRPDLDPVGLARAYSDGGAAAISVLTEADHFQGSLSNLADIREAPALEEVPLLRKDFLFDPYQVYESRASGADALLLIVAILSDSQLSDLLTLVHELGMEALVEVHDSAELARALRANARVIGINNRDLHTFKVDIATTERLRPLIPSDRVVVSESGIHQRQDIERLRDWAVDAALIGEALVTATDVVGRLRELA